MGAGGSASNGGPLGSAGLGGGVGGGVGAGVGDSDGIGDEGSVGMGVTKTFDCLVNILIANSRFWPSNSSHPPLLQAFKNALIKLREEQANSPFRYQSNKWCPIQI